jgi:hypothetical protein
MTMAEDAERDREVFSHCRTCVNERRKHGELHCANEPHRFDTQLRRETVKWLQNPRSRECPGYRRV